jgi:hypothetical protein
MGDVAPGDELGDNRVASACTVMDFGGPFPQLTAYKAAGKASMIVP